MSHLLWVRSRLPKIWERERVISEGFLYYAIFNIFVYGLREEVKQTLSGSEVCAANVARSMWLHKWVEEYQYNHIVFI